MYSNPEKHIHVGILSPLILLSYIFLVLDICPSTTFVFVRIIVKYSASYLFSPINVPNYVPNETDVNIPLNPGYLSLSLPPKINIRY